jgi:hypothetical protein
MSPVRFAEKIADHLLPSNYDVGVPNGSDFVLKAMRLAIKKYIDLPQQLDQLPTHVAVFFDLTNQFNRVAFEEFKTSSPLPSWNSFP